MKIVQLQKDDSALIESAAEALRLGFPYLPGWQTRESALEEIHDVLSEGVIFAAVEDERVLGWIGGVPDYDGNVWELHPMVVHPDHQKRGIGRALVERLENAARAADVWTIMLGTDDEDNRTTLSEIDNLYDDLYGHITRIKSRDPQKPHPFEFYQKCGYVIVGVLPDANGPHKPDIFMAKRLR